jgi:hypothetical protein
MTLGEIMLADARSAIELGGSESVAYHQAGGTVRAIRGLVDRGSPAMGEEPRGTRWTARVSVVNASADGIAADEVLTTEALTILKHAGGTETVTKRILRVASTTPGWTTVELI